jgi:hypothetical protein
VIELIVASHRQAWVGEIQVANTPEAIEQVYQKQKEEYARYRRGEKGRYHWRWSEGCPEEK